MKTYFKSKLNKLIVDKEFTFEILPQEFLILRKFACNANLSFTLEILKFNQKTN